MATNSTANMLPASKAPNPVVAMIQSVLKPLASLRLTVFLLAAAVLVTWIATLDQTNTDIWNLKKKHFSNMLVFVPFQTFFIPAWFPNLQNIPKSAGFYVPSGCALIVAMLVNLCSAHILRFRIQAKGAKLGLGLLTTLIAIGVTIAVIFAGENSDGFQDAPPISYGQMWQVMRVGLLGLSLASIAGCFFLNKEQNVERFVLGFFGAVGIGLLGVTLWLGEGAFIGDSAMRIMWQLTQATMAALIGLAACLLLFRRKAGIVLLHIGIAGLMFNEIYVTMTNEEQRMLIEEKQTTSQAIDIRYREMFVIDRSDPKTDRMTVIPAEDLVVDKKISHEDLPFDVTCVAYYTNSVLPEGEVNTPNLATIGIGTMIQPQQVAPSTGTDMDQTPDYASAYVRLTDKKTKKDIGTYLISQHYAEDDRGLIDDVNIDGKQYFIGLRFKRTYKPYSVTLEDVQRKDYLGTSTPQWFSSDVIIRDFENQNQSKRQIFMNNPLRYSGETFYQQSYIPAQQSKSEQTVIQIVKNRGWMIPYVCCMFVVVGLVQQFGATLLAYIKTNRVQASKEIMAAVTAMAGAPTVAMATTSTEDMQKRDEAFEKKRRKQMKNFIKKDSRPSSDLPVESRERPVSWLPTIFLLIVMGGYSANLMRKAVTGQVKKDEIRLDLLGKIPVTNEGRVQPLDSLARNMARQLSNREYVYINAEEHRPAIQWLADTVFEAEGFESYQILRIEYLEVLQALNLPRRKGFKYSWRELRSAEDELQSLLKQECRSLLAEYNINNTGAEDNLSQMLFLCFEKVGTKNWPLYMKRLYEVHSKMEKIYALKAAFGDPGKHSNSDVASRIANASTIENSTQVPLSVATGDSEKPWISLATAINRKWLSDLAENTGKRNVDDFSLMLSEDESLDSVRMEIFRDEMAEALMADPEARPFLSDPEGNKDKLQPIYDRKMDQVQKVTNSIVYRGLLVQVKRFNGPEEKEIQQFELPDADMLMTLEPAYLNNDSETFNTAVKSYLKSVNETPPEGMNPVTVWMEYVYNTFSPFYVSIVLYLVAFMVAMLAWIGWSDSMNRAAFWLIAIALSIHTAAIIARVAISGRPPVTSLYSSFVFVSAALVGLIMIVERITKMGMGNLLAGLGGSLALLGAWSISISEGDTFAVLRAVLDTQFWLTTHVICVSLGYTATIAAGFLGGAYIIGAIFTPAFDKRTRKSISNIIYGIVCFGLLYSFFGTVLGGLWADDSWGRFWGWDPKENGALMIVLWNAVVLHARWAGMIRDRGLAVLTLIGNIVTLWSWIAVNELGVGLHTYGFSEGRMVYVAIFWALNLAIIGLALVPMKYWSSYSKELSAKS